MKIAIYQMEIIPGEPEKNIEKVANWLSTLDDVDIAVLPEMWNTSYTLEELVNITSEEGQREIEKLSELAKQYQINIVGGSIAVRVEDKIYNRAIVINKNGEHIHQYDKLHLVPMLDEPNYLTQGNNISIFEIDNVKMGVIICYDLRFPEISRKLALEGIEVLFVVAEWPIERISQFEKLLYARAIENQVYVIASNSIGKCDDTVFGGKSMVINPLGEATTKIILGEGTIQATVNIEEIRNIRTKIPLLKTRRADIY
ncbi:carbon-nitrogen family hydrolase [Macrococcus epidermidis]|uniref:carbon-nitrogen family hydrolase n=1 Tax=Macrococcus epidermidis TaxID=1902580 RepID=UPI001EF30098|nr:carbon-nitrogen family hydrolase [Macrococcus epidermidis]MCG7420652.1 carbon-nitrogen family hydrolase [Macrococcus epidermidis]UTH15804.1 carbon-nitrogen family hydrolase [Macrococcus epidermidis]